MKLSRLLNCITLVILTGIAITLSYEIADDQMLYVMTVGIADYHGQINV